jgi:hypothetical protein
MIESITQYVTAAYSLPGWALSALFTFLLYHFLRRSNAFVTHLGPMGFICAMFCSIFTMLLAPGAPQDMPAFRWRMTNIIIGGSLGLIIVCFYHPLINYAVARVPFLKNLFDGEQPPDPKP